MFSFIAAASALSATTKALGTAMSSSSPERFLFPRTALSLRPARTRASAWVIGNTLRVEEAFRGFVVGGGMVVSSIGMRYSVNDVTPSGALSNERIGMCSCRVILSADKAMGLDGDIVIWRAILRNAFSLRQPGVNRSWNHTEYAGPA